MTTAVEAGPSHFGHVNRGPAARGTLRRLARVAWLQHRAACFGLLAVGIAFAIATLFEIYRASGSYAAFVSDGCVGHRFTLGTCNSDALTLSGGVIFQTIGTALSALPVLVGVFLGAPLVAREVESGTFRFAWTQGTSRTRLLFTTLAMLGAAVTAMAVGLGLLFGGWYAHIYDVVLYAVYTNWQSTLFATTWWMLAVWVLMALVLGTFIGTLIRRTVAAMATTAGALVALIEGSRLLLPQLLHLGADVTRLPGPDGTMAIGAINNTVQVDWPFPVGSWIARSWLTGPHGRVLDKLAVQHVSFELSSRTAGAGDRWLSLHHDVFWVAYQPPSHFWMLQGAEGVVLLAVATLCVLATARVLKRRAAA